MSDAPHSSETPAPDPLPQDELLTRVLSLNLGAAAYQRKTDCTAVTVDPSRLISLMQRLRDDKDLSFDMLMSHTVVDRIESGQFELIYYLYSLSHRKRMLVSVSIPRENPVVPTLASIWHIAEFQEREAYDLFGILYDNHTDLRRVFLEDDWKGFPLRKDYQDDFMLTHVIEEEGS